jgi:flagellar FliL protein
MRKKKTDDEPVGPAKAGKAGKADQKPKGKKKLVVLMVLLLVIAGAGYTVLGKGGTAEAAPKPEPGAVVPLESINLNLAGGHYLKLGIALQATTAVGEEPLDGSKALDIAIHLLSNRSLADVTATSARDKLQHELVTKVSEAYEGEVMDVYFTEFVSQ